jgi:hypothetical protein
MALFGGERAAFPDRGRFPADEFERIWSRSISTSRLGIMIGTSVVRALSSWAAMTSGVLT